MSQVWRQTNGPKVVFVCNASCSFCRVCFLDLLSLKMAKGKNKNKPCLTNRSTLVMKSEEGNSE
jgi:hypothetical protein